MGLMEIHILRPKDRWASLLSPLRFKMVEPTDQPAISCHLFAVLSMFSKLVNRVWCLIQRSHLAVMRWNAVHPRLACLCSSIERGGSASFSS